MEFALYMSGDCLTAEFLVKVQEIIYGNKITFRSIPCDTTLDHIASTISKAQNLNMNAPWQNN